MLVIATLTYRWALDVPILHAMAVFSLPIMVGILTSLGMTIFWNLLGRLFTLQQGKRLFGLLNSGEQIALLVSGLIVPILVLWIGTANLLLVAAALLVGSWLLLAVIARNFHNLLSLDTGKDTPLTAPPPRIPRDRYIFLLFGLYFVFMIGAYFVNNLFYTEAHAQFGDEDALASFLGLFISLTGGLSLILQFFIVPRLLIRRGVSVFLLLTPLAVMIFMTPYAILSAVSAAATILFTLAGLAHLFRIVFDAADTAAFNVLYQTIPAQIRTRVQTINDGILYPVAIGAAGVLLLVFINVIGLNETQLALMLLGIIGVWLGLARGLGLEYPRQVQQALRKRIFGEDEVLILEPINTAEIERMLQDPRPGAVLYALDMLEAADGDRLSDHLERLLSHPSSIVRTRSAELIEHHAMSTLNKAVASRLQTEESVVVRAAFKKTLAHRGDEATAEALWRDIDLGATAEQQETLAGLLMRTDHAGHELAAITLQDWMTSADPLKRTQAAYAIGEARGAGEVTLLEELLEDEVAEVRRAAIEAAGKIGSPSLWPAILQRLDVPGDAPAAAEALVVTGEPVLPFLATAVEKGQPLNEPLQTRITKIIGRIGGRQAGEILLGRFPGQNFELHTRTLESLQRCGIKIDSNTELPAQIAPDIERTAWLLTAWADISRQPLVENCTAARALLETAFEQAIHIQRQNIFRWLSLAYDHHLMRQVQFNLAISSGGRAEREQIAYAREVIDLHVDFPVREWIRPVVSVEPLDTRLAQIPARFRHPHLDPSERLATIIAASESWLPVWIRTCSSYLAGHMGVPALREALQAACRSSDSILAETACWALERIPNLETTHSLATGDEKSPVAIKEGDEMLTTVEKVILLKSVEFFSGTPDSVLAQLARLMEEVNVAAGEVIIRKGEDGDSMFVVAQGVLRVHVDNVVLAWLLEKDVFGEMALLDQAPRSASVTAVADSLLIRLGREAFSELLEDHPEIGHRVLQVMAQRLRIANGLLSALNSTPVSAE